MNTEKSNGYFQNSFVIKGQIVEIPANASLYTKVKVSPNSKLEALKSELLYKNYSLFDGFLVGEHSGTHQFKLGQRKGIKVGGKKAPLYVIGIDEAENRLFVGEGENHPGLSSRVLSFHSNDIDWFINNEALQNSLSKGISVQISAENFENTNAVLYEIDSMIYLEFEHPVPIFIATSDLKIDQQTTLIANIKTTYYLL